MKVDPLISIITPVYNVEVFLPQCLDSIISQTLQEWELILIDDGSTDQSGAICDRYATLDSRIKVVHKANTGQADSRNLGISMAKACLIGFVDSDDWIEKDMYETLYRLITENQADISMCGFYLDYLDGAESDSKENGVEVFEGHEPLALIKEDRKIKSYLWDKLFRKEMITVPLPVSFYYEDYATLLKWFSNVTKLVYIGMPKYHYRQRRGSTCNDLDPQKRYHFFLAEMERCNYLASHNLFPDKKIHFAYRVIRVGLRQAKNMAKDSSQSDVDLKLIQKISEELRQYNFVGFKDMRLFYYIQRLKLQASPRYFFYEQYVVGKLKFWKKDKQKNYY